MLLHLNGWPGVGKLTIARVAAQRLAGRVLDNHSIYNVAFALTEFRSPEFYETVREVCDVAFKRALDVPAGVPIIITNALGSSSAWADENWTAILRLAKLRQCQLIAVTLYCAAEEHLRRATMAERNYLGKLTDVEQLKDILERELLVPTGADCAISVDVTSIAPEEAVERILIQRQLPGAATSDP